MIKVGKIKVNKDISPKTFLIITIFAFLLFLSCFSYSIFYFFKTKDYIKLDAVIVDVGYEYSNYGSENESRIYYMQVGYEYNNKNYINKQRVNFRFNKNKGDVVKIYVNPNNPEEIKDTYNTNIFIFLSILTLVLTIALAKGYKIRKNYYKE